MIRLAPAMVLRPVLASLAGLLLLCLSGQSSSRALAQAPSPTAGPLPNAQSLSLLLDGYAALDQGDISGALAKFNQALTNAQQLGDHAGEIASHVATAQAYQEQGLDLQAGNDLQGALDAFNNALTSFRQAGDRQQEGRALWQIGAVNQDRYDYSKAQDFYQQALAIAREVSDATGETDAVRSLGGLLAEQGRYAEALERYQQALAIARDRAGRAVSAQDNKAEQFARSDELLILRNVASVYEAQSQYPQALAILQPQLVTARDRLSQASDSGDTLLAEVARIDVLAVLNALGNVYSDLGQYAKALNFHQQALAMAQEPNDTQIRATFLSNLATDYDNLGQSEQAIVYYQQALELVHAVDDRLREGTLLNNIGVAYTDEKQFDQALAYGNRALPLARELGDRTGEATDLSLIGSAYIGLGQYDRAVEAYQQALGIARETGDRRREGVILGRIGEAYEKAGDLERALDFDQQALATQEDIRASARLEELKAGLAAQSSRLYGRAILVLLRLGRAGEAFDLTERARARGFLDQLGNAPLDLSQRASPQLLQQEQSLSAEISALDRSLRQEQAKPAAQRSSDAIQTLSTELAAKQQQYADLLTQLRLSDPESASLVSTAPLRLADVQGLLDPATTLVSYFVTQDRTLAFVVSQTSFREVDLPASADELQAAILDFRSFRNLNPATPPRSLQQLYDWLVAPLADQLTTPLVGIVPNATLSYVPFAALWDGQQYFGDRQTLFELPSASALPFVQAKRKGVDATALVMAQSQVEGYPTLAYADREAETVATLFGTQALIGPAATEAAFKARAGQANVVHVAGHGDLDPDNPLFSRILLQADAGDDGSLEVREVYGLRLTNTDLIVLSACQTQVGADTQAASGGSGSADEFVGLSRAFIYAGSPTVVASLWEVDDQATAILMAAFYAHLRQGMGKAEALQAAQADTREQFPNPYYWAAFVLTGDPGTAATTPFADALYSKRPGGD